MWEPSEKRRRWKENEQITEISHVVLESIFHIFAPIIFSFLVQFLSLFELPFLFSARVERKIAMKVRKWKIEEGMRGNGRRGEESVRKTTERQDDWWSWGMQGKLVKAKRAERRQNNKSWENDEKRRVNRSRAMGRRKGGNRKVRNKKIVGTRSREEEIERAKMWLVKCEQEKGKNLKDLRSNRFCDNEWSEREEKRSLRRKCSVCWIKNDGWTSPSSQDAYERRRNWRRKQANSEGEDCPWKDAKYVKDEICVRDLEVYKNLKDSRKRKNERDSRGEPAAHCRRRPERKSEKRMMRRRIWKRGEERESCSVKDGRRGEDESRREADRLAPWFILRDFCLEIHAHLSWNRVATVRLLGKTVTAVLSRAFHSRKP